MFKYAVVIFAVIACAVAKPGLVVPLAYTAPAAIVAAPSPVITATSSQFIARNYNGIATTPVVAPIAAPIVAAYTSPVVAKYAAAHPLAYSSPLTYAAAPAPVLL